MCSMTNSASESPLASDGERSDPLIQVRNLTMAYGRTLVQEHLNFDVQRGDIFVIMGGSGCGKSTLLKQMIGLTKPAKGEILIDGINFFTAPAERQLEMRRHWGVTYQRGGLFSDLTLEENIALPLQQYTAMKAAEIRDLVDYKLSLVGLAGFGHYYPSEISGGMQKRAALARAIALDPDILFFDEPSAGLDPLSSQRLDELIVEINESMGGTVVIVTHELASIFSIATNAVFLDAETKTQLDCGPPLQLLKHSKHEVVRRFLSRGAIEPGTGKQL